MVEGVNTHKISTVLPVLLERLVERPNIPAGETERTKDEMRYSAVE